MSLAETMSFRSKYFKPCEQLQDLYGFFNEKFFNHKLPFVYVGYYHHKDNSKCYGCTLRLNGARFPSYILMNPYFKGWMPTIQAVMLHEMCHVKLLNKGGHGPKFAKEIQRLVDMGAFTPML